MDWRYEIKYAIDNLGIYHLKHIIDSHPAGFYTSYPDRKVNNLYFDTPNYDACRNNIAGISERKKIRIRWYGEEECRDAVLEHKLKKNSLGAKKIESISGLNNSKELMDYFNNSLNTSVNLIPTINNEYDRSYFESADGHFRITLDQNLRYQSALDFSMGMPPVQPNDRHILEVKFKREKLKDSKKITSYIPFRQTKNSKYVTGILTCLAYR